jgi:hypothetical protein
MRETVRGEREREKVVTTNKSMYERLSLFGFNHVQLYAWLAPSTLRTREKASLLS